MEGHRRARATVRARVKYTSVVSAAAVVALVGALTPGSRPAHAQTSSHTSTAATTSGPNLLTGNEATFSGTTGGWVGSNSLLTPGLATPALQVTARALSWVSAWSPLPPSGQRTPATPGAKYTGDANVEVNVPSPSIGDALVFFNSAGSILTAVWGQAVTPTSSTWTTLPQVGATAPSSTAYVALGVVSWTALLGQDFLLRSPTINAITAPAVAPSVIGPLHTSGNQILQANGQPVTLRGVVMPGLEQSGTLTGTGVSKQAVVEAKAWGANFVRVPLGEQFWLQSNCDYVPGYMSTVDEVVHWITALGMVALLDLHTNTVGGCEPGGPHNMADEAQAPTFWSEVASRYGNPSSPEYDPLVAFDLYNEPHNVSNAVWLDGGKTTDYYGGQSYQAAGMQQLYGAVRAAGSKNLVFLSGLNWANTPPTTLVTGDNIVYAVHYYTCQSDLPPACTNSDPYDPAQDLSQWVGLSASQPVVVTEFGWPSQGSGTYDLNVIGYAASHGWGWSAFAWEDRQYPTQWDLTLSWLGDGTAEPSASGLPVFLALSRAT
jgi:aryl-phospho-beta-D-glucosidase BglC (GH1 family)